MSEMMTTIDPVRAEIMRLENEATFDPAAWDRVFRALRQQGRESGYEDAWRRMRTALDNAETILPDPILDVSAGTEPA